jgi:hypothetical protein
MIRGCLLHGRRPVYREQSTMNSDNPKLEITIGSIRSFGWQRRADLDTSLGQVWESPDGKLQMFPRGVEPKVTKLNTRVTNGSGNNQRM